MMSLHALPAWAALPVAALILAGSLLALQNRLVTPDMADTTTITP